LSRNRKSGSTDNKTRIGFRTHLHDGQPCEALNDIAPGPPAAAGLKAVLVERLQTTPFAGGDWAAYVELPPWSSLAIHSASGRNGSP
jgi:hypothetical protein